uniref:Putative secreted protein n=1 Tax=Rhipicephalus microplus TaxID=6941 RepID=A0A6M2DCQ2_RHIMP
MSKMVMSIVSMRHLLSHILGRIVRCPKRGSLETSSLPSLNALCHLLDCNLKMQSFFKAFRSIWNVSVRFFSSFT